MSFAFFGAQSLSRREAHARAGNGDTRQDGECASVRTVNDESNHSRMNGRSYTLVQGLEEGQFTFKSKGLFSTAGVL